MANADWLLEVGVDTRNATTALTEFTKKAEELLKPLGNTIELTVDASSLVEKATPSIDKLKALIKKIPSVNVTFNLAGATRSMNTLAAAIDKNAGTYSRFGYMLEFLNEKVEDSMTHVTRLAVVLRESAEAVRIISNYLRSASANVEVATRTVQVYTRALEAMNRTAGETSSAHSRATSSLGAVTSATKTATSAHNSQHDALERIGKILDNTVFKFVEYEVVMRAFNAVVHEFTSSVTEASNVQFESTLQKLYAPTVNLNNALSDSISIAKAYGGTITDVQQAIGLWTKITQDETSAAYLAMEAEKLRRISGIDTLDVFKDSVAVLKQMGLAASDLPRVYDQIAAAALRIAEPLKNMGKGGAEGVKDMMDGLTRFGAVGKSVGLDTTGIIAMVANQVQSGSEGGKQSGGALATMFGALDAGGTSKANFDKIIGPIKGDTDYEKSLNLMKQIEAEAPKLSKAMADGLIRTKPGQVETFDTLKASIKGTIALMEELHKSSAGKLDLITDAELKTYQGRMDQLSAATQEFGLQLGHTLLPAATGLAITLSQGLVPALTANIGLLGGLAQIGGSVVAALVAMQIADRVALAFSNQATSLRVTTAELYNNAAAEGAATAAGFDNLTMMNDYIAEAARLGEAQILLTESFTAFGIACGASGSELSDFVAAEMAAVGSTGALEAALASLVAEEVTLEGTTAMFLSSLGAMAVEALAVVGPLALVAAGIWGVTTAMGSASAAGAAKQGLHSREQATLEGHQSIWQQLDPRSLLADVPDAFRDTGVMLSGNNSHYDDAWKYAQSISHNKSDPGREAAEYLGRINSHKDDKNETELTRDYNGLDALYTNHIQSNAFTNTDAKTKEIMARLAKEEADQKAQLAEFFRKQSNPDGAVDADGKPAKGTASGESQIMGEIQRTTKDYQSHTTELHDSATAEKELAEAILAHAKAVGISQQAVNEYSAALKRQEVDLKGELDLRKQEADALQQVYDKAHANAKGANPGTTKGQHALADESLAHANLVKTLGAVKLLTEQYGLLIAQDANYRASEQLTFDIHASGLDNFTEKIAAVKKSIASQTDAPSKLSAANSGTNTLTQDLAALNKIALDPRLGGNQAALADINKLILDTHEALDEVAKSASDVATAAADASDSLHTLGTNVMSENAVDIAKALGLDTGSLDALTTNIDQYKKLAEEIKSATSDYDKTLQTPGDTAAYQSIINEIRYREQLIPILAQEAKAKADIKKVEDSAEFKTFDNAFQKLGDNAIDKSFKSMSKNGAGGEFISSIITGELKDSWNKISKEMTEGMFHVDKSKEKEKSLQEVYETYIPKLQTAMDTFKDAVDKLIPGTISGSGSILGGPDIDNGVDKLLGESTSSSKSPTGKVGFSLSNAMNGVMSSKQGDDLIKGLTDPSKPLIQALTYGNPTQASDSLSADQATADNTAKMVPGGTSSTGTSSDANVSAMSEGLMFGAGGGSGPSSASSAMSSLFAGSGSSNPYSAILNSANKVIPGASKATQASGGSGGGLTSLLGNIFPGLGRGSSSAAGGLSNMSFAGSLGLGLTAGNLVGTLMGGGSHNTNGDIGATLGAVIGSVVPGIGTAVGSLIGGGLGGLFGSSTSPAKNPDMYDPNFAQVQADLTGKQYYAQDSGTAFMSAGTASQTGGQGQISSIEELLAKYPNPQDAPAWLQPYYAQGLATFGASSTGSGVLKYGKNIGQEYVSGAAGASTSAQSYQTIDALATSIEQAQSLHTNQAQAPILSINAYGSNGAYGNSIYNTPGLTSTQYSALQQNGFSGAALSNYYATPGVGTSTAGQGGPQLQNAMSSVLGASQPINITTNLQVDGQTLATIVNSANAAMASRTSTS